MKKWYKSKTYWFNIALASVGVIEANMGLIRDNLGDNYGIVFMAVAVIGIALRNVTTSEVSK